MTQLAQILRKKSLLLNLFSTGDREKLEEKHIPDALAILDFARLKGRVMDLGTGGGLPGLALAIKNPEVDFVLVDAREKKVKAVAEVAEELGLKNVECVAGRFEELAHGEMREGFDFVLARAVAELRVLLEYAAGFLDVGGKLYAWKSTDYKVELAAAEKAAELLEMEFVKAHMYELEGFGRVILEFVKIGILDEKYPRRDGVPKAKPL